MKSMTLAAMMIVVVMECPAIAQAIESAIEPQTIIVAEAVTSGSAASIAARATGGKVLSVENAGNVFLVKVLLGNGQVKIVQVDAATGAVR
jgi:uncharacterized membrane protein YkoI